MLAVLARKFETERLFQCGAQRCQAGQVRLPFHARFGIARVRGKKPRYFFGRGERRGLQQDSRQIFIQRISDGFRQLLRIAK
jgi:hypothetical protein